MKYDFFCGIGCLILIALTWYMVANRIEYWGWVLFAAVVFGSGTVISKKQQEGECDCDKEDDEK